MNTSKSDNKTLTIELFKVDMSSKGLSTCSACDKIKGNLNESVTSVESLLAELGFQVKIQETIVKTESEAQKYDLVASPTIQVGSFRYHPDHKGLGEEKRWKWNGHVFSFPPKEVLIEVILRGFLGEKKENEYPEITPYVEQFFTDKITADTCSCG